MADLDLKPAIELAVSVSKAYEDAYGSAAFPTLKDRLFPILVHRASVDNVYVNRFKETMHPIVGQMRRVTEVGAPYTPEETSGIIYLCPSLELAWQRYVQVKETCHLILDTPQDYVIDAARLDHLMVCLAQFGSEEIPREYHSELSAMVSALEILFPFQTRQRIRERFDAGDIAVADLVTRARVPGKLIRMAMSSNWREEIEPIYDCLESQDDSPEIPGLNG